VFDLYNRARTYDEIKPIVSGVLAQQYAAVATRDPQQLPRILAQQHVESYRARVVEIDGATSFLVLENVTSKSSGANQPQAYLLAKQPSGGWTLANRMMPDSVLKTLWTTRFEPAQFAQPASCAIDGKEVKTHSALAVGQRDSIEVTLFPFAFSQADLDYWRQASGIRVNQEAIAGSHFVAGTPTVCRLIVKVDKANQLSLMNVGFDDSTASPSRSSLWQPSKADVSRLTLDQGAINLVTAGAVGTGKDAFRWNVNVNVPVWQRGL